MLQGAACNYFKMYLNALLYMYNSRACEGIVNFDKVCLQGRHCRLREVLHECDVGEVGVNLCGSRGSAPGHVHLAAVLVVGRVRGGQAGLPAVW